MLWNYSQKVIKLMVIIDWKMDQDSPQVGTDLDIAVYQKVGMAVDHGIGKK